eukprot:gene10078-7048_t
MCSFIVVNAACEDEMMFFSVGGKVCTNFCLFGANGYGCLSTVLSAEERERCAVVCLGFSVAEAVKGKGQLVDS